ncbi:MAG: hypothetical protein IT364_01920 [Candidatus Hydrogenedentes bacterium]|nr:hypothetical protein [Candidatus Hydrogenedentota bacterium]
MLRRFHREAPFLLGRVQTLRGSAHGVIVHLLEDGRVVWQPEGVGGELVTLPEALRRA